MTKKIFFLLAIALFIYGCGEVIEQQEYDTIKEGMSYQDVSGILGFDGTEETDIPDSLKIEGSVRYYWVDKKGSVVLCVFINNKLFIKTAGLVEEEK